MWIIKNILPEFLANSFLFGVLMLFAGVFFVGVFIDGVKYHEGFAENFIIAGFAVISFLVAISCLF